MNLRVVDVQRDRGLVTLTFDRPDKKNALNRQSWNELDEALTEIAGNHEDRALMLTGAGGIFSSGADLSGDQSGGMTQGRVGPAVIAAALVLGSGR